MDWKSEAFYILAVAASTVLVEHIFSTGAVKENAEKFRETKIHSKKFSRLNLILLLAGSRIKH